ncbi:cysteine synthase [Collibacillus ludicampi]|uniref:Cysteine synthase n=1 Tax=Collibacillus ludicampi TaxID=2771369 RepID=A0AAV4LKD9_9BACL|nr:aminotransferase class I/II-fold pyridoxal phosphate-dependent enzyme [Collibacillus ludicampi]GIM48225.1 cysteine synthase [Collibacillus ludicampi]
MRMDTLLAQVGNRKDPVTGAISFPIHHSTTFAHPSLGQSTGFDYTRTLNPTRKVLEEAIAELEGGCRGFAFASGMAAVSCVFTLFRPGDHLIVSNDLYGGTYRLLEQVFRSYGLEATYIDTSDLNAVEASLLPSTKAVFVETPTNPTMKITDLQELCRFAKRHNILSIVDNTFMTPYLQRPLDWGADLVVHSATKYLGGHNDVLAGLVVARDPELAERLYFLQNSIGAVLGPQDCWLLLRGIKTLALRMERHQENAWRVAQWLSQHPLVEKVYYPGLETHPGYDVQKKQSKGFGGMLSFDVVDERLVEHILSAVRLVTFAESLGGVESLITYPARQTHFDIPEEIRNSLGVTNRLLRFSVGIEHHEDIISDLDHALTVSGSVLERS